MGPDVRMLVKIDKGDGQISSAWMYVGDAVKFTHTAQIRLDDGRSVPAGPERIFMVSLLAAQEDEVLDSEYVPADAGKKPWLAKTWDRLTGRATP